MHFTLNGRHYFTQYSVKEDDSRFIVEGGPMGSRVLRFSSDLRITNGQGESMGRLASGFGDEWVLTNKDGSTWVCGKIHNYHWDALERAEVEAAKVLLAEVA